MNAPYGGFQIDTAQPAQGAGAMEPGTGLAGRLKVLATGFLPFGPDAYNASGIAARSLDGQRIHAVGPRGYVDADIVGRGEIPVVGADQGSDHSAADLVIQAIHDHRPDVVICFGQGNNTTFGVEIRARDGADRPHDPRLYNPSIVYHDPRIPRDARAGYRPSYDSTFDADRVVAAIQAVGGNAGPSDNAGGYVCEDLLYHVLRYAQQHAADVHIVAAGFIHVPRWVRVDVRIEHYFRPDAAIRKVPGFGSNDFVPNDNGKAPPAECVPQSLINLAAYRAVEAAVTGVRSANPSPARRGSPSLDHER